MVSIPFLYKILSKPTNVLNIFFLYSQTARDAEETTNLVECARQMGLKPEKFEILLANLATVMCDTQYIAQLLTINAKINTLAEDN